MGNCCSAVCGGKREDGEEEERSWLLGKGGKSEELPDKYEWEQNVMVQNVMKSGKISHAAIVSLSNGELRAVGPKNFRPHKNAIRNILKALKGDTAGIAEDGIVLGGGTNVCTPGKLEEGKAIYGSDGKGGGCSIFQTKETVLICVYNSDAAVATRLAAEVAEYITDEGGR